MNRPSSSSSKRKLSRINLADWHLARCCLGRVRRSRMLLLGKVYSRRKQILSLSKLLTKKCPCLTKLAAICFLSKKPKTLKMSIWSLSRSQASPLRKRIWSSRWCLQTTASSLRHPYQSQTRPKTSSSFRPTFSLVLIQAPTKSWTSRHHYWLKDQGTAVRPGAAYWSQTSLSGQRSTARTQ